MPTQPKNPPRFRVALAGLGTVGGAVIRLLQEESARLHRLMGAELDLTVIFDRSYKNKDVSWLQPATRLTDSIDEFLASPADIVVELIGGEEPAGRILRESLQRQKAVVTANKQLMAASGGAYLELAEKSRAYLGFEASVAGGIPILRTLRRSLIADRILSVRGILNGTCNFILSEVRVGVTNVWSGRVAYKLLKEDNGFKIAFKKIMLVDNAEAVPTLSFLI